MSKSKHKISRIEYVILAVILLFGLAVRLYKIDTSLADWHSWRQTATANVARIYVDEGTDLFHPKYYDISTAQTGHENPNGYWFVEFPLYGAFHSFIYRGFGGVRFVEIGRLISTFAAMVSIVFVYLLGKRHISAAGGLLAAAFFAFIPFNIYYTRVILPEPMAVAFGLSALWFFVKFVDTNKNKWLWLSGVFFAISILVKPFTVFYGVPMLYLAWRKDGGGLGIIKDRRLWIFVGIALIPFLMWRIWMSAFPEGIPHFKWAFNGDGIRFRPAFWRWMAGERLGKLILGFWGLIPFVFGLISYNKKHAFVHWFLAGVILFIVVFATANVRHDYYQIVAIPAVCLVLALGAVKMWNVCEFNRFIARLVLVFSVFMTLFIGWFQVREFYKINRPEIVTAGERVNKLVPKESLVIAPYNKDMAFLYHTKRRGWPFIDGSLEDMIDKGASYYVSVNYNTETLNIMEKYEVVESTNEYVIIKLY